jgi:hypothetical protein
MNTQNSYTDKGEQVSPSLKFIFEGRTFEWHKQYITEAEIRQAANIPDQAGDLFLEICDPWKDERVKDHEPIDLARKGIEQFYLRKPLPYFINEVRYESNSQYIRGRRIRHQGGIPSDYDIFLVIEEPWENELIEDDTWVNLARPGREKFISKPAAVDIIILVNSRPKQWNKRKITFEEVVTLQYGQYDPNPQISYSVTYKNGPKENSEGMMSVGQTVFVKNKMSFHVSRTNQS